MNISSLLRTTTLIMGAYTYYMRNLKSLNMFKIYKAEVENQLNRKIKAVRSDMVVSTMTDTTDQVDI